MCFSVLAIVLLYRQAEISKSIFIDLSNSFKFDLGNHGNLLRCLGGTPVARHGEENLSEPGHLVEAPIL